MKKSWDNVSPQDLAECELTLLSFLNGKLDHAGHRNTLDKKFEHYKGDVMGTTLRIWSKRVAEEG